MRIAGRLAGKSMNKSNTMALTSRKPLLSSSTIAGHFPLVNQGGTLSGPRRITHCRQFASDAIGDRSNNGTASGDSGLKAAWLG
jgi:hypothetical protein